jgi:hypothetical protein
MPYPLDLKMKDFGFNNWTEAAANSKNLFNQGHIDGDEYGAILARAKQEQQGKSVATQQQQIPPVPHNSQPQPNPNADPMNGRALPMQSLPTWDQVQRFLRELSGPRPAY